MTQQDLLKKLKLISSVANDILFSDYTDEKKYDMIFSKKISQQVHDSFRESPIRFEYYDPDTSYYEDMSAFIDALSSHIVLLENYNEKDLNENDDTLYDRFLNL